MTSSASVDAPNNTLDDRAQLELLRLIGERSELTQREVAAVLGMSLGKANFCLRALIARGLVKAENYRKSDNKSAYLYLITPRGIARKVELTRLFLARRMREYERLKLEIEQLRQETEAAE